MQNYQCCRSIEARRSTEAYLCLLAAAPRFSAAVAPVFARPGAAISSACAASTTPPGLPGVLRNGAPPPAAALLRGCRKREPLRESSPRGSTASSSSSSGFTLALKNSSARSSRLISENHPNAPLPRPWARTRGGHQCFLRVRRRRREPAQAPRQAEAPSVVRAIGRSAGRGGASAVALHRSKKAFLLVADRNVIAVGRG